MTDRYRIATQPGGTVVWDSQGGVRMRVFNRRVDAQAAADRLNAQLPQTCQYCGQPIWENEIGMWLHSIGNASRCSDSPNRAAP